MNKLTTVDLFAGAGGLSCGFVQTGKFNVVLAVEINKHAQDTYKNFHKNTRIESDIKHLNYVDLLTRFGNIDVVIGGPPCQGFSNANRQRNHLISGNNQLVKEFIKAVENLKPRAFVMENVKTIASKKHKFFYSSKDELELNSLKIELNEEFISISESLIPSNELINFLQDSNQLNNYALPKHIYSRLNSMYKKSKSKVILEEYIVKHTSGIKKVINSWNNFLEPNWCEDYKIIFNETKNLLQACVQNNISFEKLKINLKVIIEVQKAIYKMREIYDNNVALIDLKEENKNICILVKTYNVIDYVLKKFEHIGYKVDKGILNAAQFGVPQTRKRFVIIGISEGETNLDVKLPEPIFQSSSEYFTIGDAILDLEDYEPFTEITKEEIIKSKKHQYSSNPLRQYYNHYNCSFLHNHVSTNTRESILERFNKLKPGQNFHDLDKSYKTTYSNPMKTQNTIYQRLDYNAPSGTVLNVRKSMWIHPTKNRAVSIREAARLQSFPDHFIFFGPKDAQYQQIGNAVPPLLGRAVAEKVLDLLGLKPEKKLEDILQK